MRLMVQKYKNALYTLDMRVADLSRQESQQAVRMKDMPGWAGYAATAQSCDDGGKKNMGKDVRI